MKNMHQRWNFAESFSGAQIAYLIAGIDPDSDTNTGPPTPILKRIKKGYDKALVAIRVFPFPRLEDINPLEPRQPIQMPLDSLPSRYLHEMSKGGFPDDFKKGQAPDPFLFEAQLFNRFDIQIWLDANNLSSEYQFYESKTPHVKSIIRLPIFSGDWFSEAKQVIAHGLRSNNFSEPASGLIESICAQKRFEVHISEPIKFKSLPAIIASAHNIDDHLILKWVMCLNPDSGRRENATQAELNEMNVELWRDWPPLVLGQSLKKDLKVGFNKGLMSDSYMKRTEDKWDFQIQSLEFSENLSPQQTSAILESAHKALLTKAVVSGVLKLKPPEGLSEQAIEARLLSGNTERMGGWTVSESDLQAYLNLLDGDWSIEANPLAVESSQPTPVVASISNITTNPSKTFAINRTNCLSAVIKSAQQNSADPFDVHRVWTNLCDECEKPEPASPLIELHDGRILYRFNGENKPLTKKNLGDRLRREKAKSLQH